MPKLIVNKSVTILLIIFELNLTNVQLFVAEATYVRRLATEAILQPHIFHFILKYIKTFLRCILITLLFLFKNSLAFINKIKTPISVKGYWHFCIIIFLKHANIQHIQQPHYDLLQKPIPQHLAHAEHRLLQIHRHVKYQNSRFI